jgi:polyhydroxyalkanoate synthesis regulator protein
MKIQLSEKVFLESDSMQFIIRKYTGRIDEKTQQETYTNLGYFSNFKSALKHIVKMDLLESDLESFVDVQDRLNAIEKKIDKAILDVKP